MVDAVALSLPSIRFGGHNQAVQTSSAHRWSSLPARRDSGSLANTHSTSNPHAHTALYSTEALSISRTPAMAACAATHCTPPTSATQRPPTPGVIGRSAGNVRRTAQPNASLRRARARARIRACTRVRACARTQAAHPNTPPPASAGLRTPSPPRCNTCVYRIVVATSECPSSS